MILGFIIPAFDTKKAIPIGYRFFMACIQFISYDDVCCNNVNFYGLNGSKHFF